MKLVLPLLLLLLGVGGGVGAGMFLAPPEPDLPDMALEDPCGPGLDDDTQLAGASPVEDSQPSGEREYARLSNQFVVPVVRDEKVASLVVVSLSVEVPFGRQELVFEKEPKLRDAFLQVLFEHANLGGFEGNFTATTNMRTLREALRSAARDSIGPEASDVLILEMVRQDV